MSVASLALALHALLVPPCDVPAPQLQQAPEEEVLRKKANADEAGRVIGEALLSSGKLWI